MDHVDEKGLTSEECHLVVEVLAMFSVLKDSYDKLDDKSGIKEGLITFVGFSGNDETDHMAYAEYYCREGSFAELFNLPDFSFNSHFPMLDRYKRQIDAWTQSAQKYELTREDILRIGGAATYKEEE